ncbi:MAG: tetratricopeptide repeat protein [Clostridiales bacterium]|nr:tetratricopeptide repeat protein [Clostridiales bacterium]
MKASQPGGPIRPVPQQRIAEKVNECMSRRDYPGVERVLQYWLAEARAGNDLRGQLMIQGELVGHYRKTGERDKAHQAAEEALRLIRALAYEDSISAATAYVNIATAYHSFGENGAALPLFEKARAIYENSPGTEPGLLGGLYNNMGLCCAALRRFEEAFSLYGLAMEKMGHVPNGAIEQAVTCLNMANAIEGQKGMEAGEKEIDALLDRAQALLDGPALPRSGYYAYVCEQCAPTFEYYGYFAAAQELTKRAEAIYERA